LAKISVAPVIIPGFAADMVYYRFSLRMVFSEGTAKLPLHSSEMETISAMYVLLNILHKNIFI
jgi:hypothetical protein